MLFRYKGDGKKVSFVTGEIYKAMKISDKMGESYAIFDEGEDWYRYSVNFVNKNFDEVSIINLSSEGIHFKSDDSSAPISHLA